MDPTNAKAYFNKGADHYRLEEYSEAIACSEKALKLDPNYADAYNLKGVSLSAEGELEEAIECYKNAIKYDAENAVAYYNCSIAYSVLGYEEEAITYLKAACELNNSYRESAAAEAEVSGGLFDSIKASNEFKAIINQ